MRTPTAILAGVVATLATALVLTGCASPKTTYVTDAGTEVTVDWEDYPGNAITAEVNTSNVPTRAEIEATWGDLSEAIESDLTERFAVDWHVDGAPSWSEAGDADDNTNGYGGASMIESYTSALHVADGAPTSVEGWHEVLDVINGHIEPLGIGLMELDYDSEEGRERESTEKFTGTDNPDEFWIWWATAVGPSHRITLNLVDIDRDLTGTAEKSWGESHRSMTLTYTGTTVGSDYRSEYAAALEPFVGLERPAPVGLN